MKRRIGYQRVQGRSILKMLEGVRPLCRVCGFAKGGQDSWDGEACKCGLTEPPIIPVEPDLPAARDDLLPKE